MSAPLKPFVNDTQAVTIAGDLSVENGLDAVTLSGSLEITRDKAGLAHAKELRTLLTAIVESLEGNASLPERVISNDDSPTYVSNSFGT
jgi:hypothetical protein